MVKVVRLRRIDDRLHARAQLRVEVVQLAERLLLLLLLERGHGPRGRVKRQLWLVAGDRLLPLALFRDVHDCALAFILIVFLVLVAVTLRGPRRLLPLLKL